jgi:hypothetical protein
MVRRCCFKEDTDNHKFSVRSDRGVVLNAELIVAYLQAMTGFLGKAMVKEKGHQRHVSWEF